MQVHQEDVVPFFDRLNRDTAGARCRLPRFLRCSRRDRSPSVLQVEERHRLALAVFQHFQLFGTQIPDEIAVPVGRHQIHQNQFSRRLEGGDVLGPGGWPEAAGEPEEGAEPDSDVRNHLLSHEESARQE